jgi:hypothetical protein
VKLCVEERHISCQTLPGFNRQQFILLRQQVLARELDRPGEKRRAGKEDQVRDRHGGRRADDGKKACLGYQGLLCRLVTRKLEDQSVIDVDGNAVPPDCAKSELRVRKLRK